MRITFDKYDELVNLKDLKRSRHQRNKHPKEQIERLAKIMAEHGVRQPIHVSKQTGEVVFGHGRWEAAKLNGWAEFPVVHQDFKDETEEYSCVQSDNAIAAWAELDLSAINMDIGNLGPDFDIDLLGIEGFKLDAPFEAQSDEDEVPEHVEPNAKVGDIYKLGRHRLMCGDSTRIELVESLLEGKLADVIFTDPPYGISLGFETKEQAKARNRRTDGLRVSNDDLAGDDLQRFLVDTLSAADAVVKPGAAFYVCSPIGAEVRKFISAIESVGWHYQSGLVWNKHSLSLSRHDYHPKHEIIHYGWKKGEAHKWIGDRKQTTVFDFDKPSRSEHHPTTKPVELICYYLSNVDNGGMVVDIFGGSGSTLIACEKTNRTCYMMELDPHYIDVIVARWEKYTGQKAELLERVDEPEDVVN